MASINAEEEALNAVKSHSFQMKCSLDKGRLMDALNNASSMLNELRTSLLSPKSYYELYMAVTDQLRHLVAYLMEEFERGRKLADLYEVVQHAGNIIPRLYLLITVGLVYMKTTPTCRKEILKDLVEMCGGVQHSLRGLFLRNYLLQMCREVLPGQDSENQGTLQDSLDFILTNFAEMNKLWVRIQHQGHSRDKERREKERLELRLLVGTNLVRLSQLEALDVNCYKETVLPGILEQIVSCRDAIAQEYLMECLIQVFPDEFHLATLRPFLNSCAQLMTRVNVRSITIALIDRLSKSEHVDLPDNLFELLSQQISNMIESRPEIEIEGVIAMETSLINFSTKRITNKTKQSEAINSVLKSAMVIIKEKTGSKTLDEDSLLNKELLRFLKVPIRADNASQALNSMKLILNLENYRTLLEELHQVTLNKQIALSLMNPLIDDAEEETTQKASEESDAKLSLNEISLFIDIICKPLVKNVQTDDYLKLNEEEKEAFIDEQVTMAKFLHVLLSPQVMNDYNFHTRFEALNNIANTLSQSGPHRMKHTFPCIIFRALQLVADINKARQNTETVDGQISIKDVFEFTTNQIDKLIVGDKDSTFVGLTVRLCLKCSEAAMKTDLPDKESLASEYVAQAFRVQERTEFKADDKLESILFIINSIKALQFQQYDIILSLAESCFEYTFAGFIAGDDRCRIFLAVMSVLVDVDNVDGKQLYSYLDGFIKSLFMMEQDKRVGYIKELLTHLEEIVNRAGTGLAKYIDFLRESMNDRFQVKNSIPKMLKELHIGSD